jgi:hypothetical protein
LRLLQTEANSAIAEIQNNVRALLSQGKMGFLTIGLFSILLAIAPLAFFSLVRRRFFDEILSSLFGSGFLDSNRVVLGGVLAVVLVTIVLFLFVIVAFVFEKPAPTKKRGRAKSATFGEAKKDR